MAPQLHPSNPIRVGVIGAGEVSQVIHLPTLGLLHHLYTTVAICDVSQAAVEHAQAKFHIPYGCQDSQELCARPDIDLVVVASADEYHAEHAVQAAHAAKHVLLEKPMALTRREAGRIAEACARTHVHIFIGYMRRYTPAWATFLDELQDAGTIQFARVFDYSGPNSIFVGQSSTHPAVFGQDVGEAERREAERRGHAIAVDVLGEEKARDARLVKVFRLLGSLGSHDISCMRHALGGVPQRCTTAFAAPSGDFVGATFQYDQQPDGTPGPFQVSYETGIHAIGTFDAYMEVYCTRAIVRIDYDTPYVKGLPIRITVRRNTGAQAQGYEERVVRPTYVDAYSAEFIRLDKALRCAAQAPEEALERRQWGASAQMCTPADAVKDLDVFDMILRYV